MEEIGRRAKMREERIKQILDITQKLVLKEGFGANLMSEIAKECGISRQRLYSYYENLNAILADLHDVCVKRLADNFSSKANRKLKKNIKLDNFFDFYFELNDDVLFLSAYEIYAQKNEIIKTSGSIDNIPVLYDMILKGQEEGKIRKDFTAKELAYLVGQLIYSYCFRAMVMQDGEYGKLLFDKRIEKEIKKMINSLLKG